MMMCVAHPHWWWCVLLTLIKADVCCSPSFLMICVVHPHYHWRVLLALITTDVCCSPSLIEMCVAHPHYWWCVLLTLINGGVLTGLAVWDLHPHQPTNPTRLRSVRKSSPCWLPGAIQLRGQRGGTGATEAWARAGGHHAAGRCIQVQHQQGVTVCVFVWVFFVLVFCLCVWVYVHVWQFVEMFFWIYRLQLLEGPVSGILIWICLGWKWSFPFSVFLWRVLFFLSLVHFQYPFLQNAFYVSLQVHVPVGLSFLSRVKKQVCN